MSFFVINLKSKQWVGGLADKAFAIKGSAYYGDKKLSPSDLISLIKSARHPVSLVSILQGLNGFYAWIDQTNNNCLRAAVDHIRSWPLFYGQAQGILYLSDDAEWVRSKVGNQTFDPIAKEEFLLSGYVTGQDTLYPDVKQIQAGEYLEASNSNGILDIRLERYYRFLHSEPHTFKDGLLQQQLQHVTLNAMRRLISYADGRQLVIPLSGGYDSRLIVSILKKLEYENIVCFTYGVSGNKESEYSKKVASSLGLKWFFIEYSKDAWRKEWNSPEAKSYREMASGHVSLPHVQDWLAVKKLVSEEKISRDSIFVPGHSGDFVAGSHIPDCVFERKKHSEESLIDSLVNYHFSNCPKNDMQLGKPGFLARRINSRLELPFDGSDVCFANLFETWDWQERQSKYIVNSVRVYDQFGFDWWLPLWDLEFVRFWEGVPLSLRRKRIWFKNWIQNQYAEATGSTGDFDLKNASETSIFSSFIKQARKLVPYLPNFLVRLVKRNYNKKAVVNHFLAFDALVPDGLISDYSESGYNIIGMYSDMQINDKW